MTRYPHAYFLKFLLLKGEDVKARCEELSLPVPTESFLKQLSTSLATPENLKEDNKECVELLRQEGIYNLIFQDKVTVDAFKILFLLEPRAAIEKLIISREEPVKIAKVVNTKYKTKLSAESIERFRHYFWNPELMRVEDWVELYKDYEKSQIRQICLNGPDYAKHVIGFIQGIQVKESLKEAASILHFDMQAIKFSPPDKDKVRALSDIVNSLIKIDHELNTSQDSIKKELENFERIQIQHAETNIKGILDVAEVGNFQGSGSDLREVTRKAKVIEFEDV